MAGIFRFCRLSDEAIIFGSVGHIATHIVEKSTQNYVFSHN